MKRPVAVIDTHVVVSGLMSADPRSFVGRTLDGMLAARFVFMLSPALLKEYRLVTGDRSLLKTRPISHP